MCRYSTIIKQRIDTALRFSWYVHNCLSPGKSDTLLATADPVGLIINADSVSMPKLTIWVTILLLTDDYVLASVRCLVN
jgi:hypothetical protein